MFLSLNGSAITVNHVYVDISGIGYTTRDALICHTGSDSSQGEWFAPDGSRVYGSNVNGLTSSTSSKVVRLERTMGVPLQGIYYCSIEDTEQNTKLVYAGLYNSGQGSVQLYTLNIFELMFNSQEMYQ